MTILHNEMAIWRCYEDMSVLKGVSVDSGVALERSGASEDRRKCAWTAGGEMKDDANRSGKVARQIRDHASQSFDTAGGSPYDDEISAQTTLICHRESP
jgi:hypothetical protein